MKRLKRIFLRTLLPLTTLLFAAAPAYGATELFDQTAALYNRNFVRGVNWQSERGVPLSSTPNNPKGSDGRAPNVPVPTRGQFQGGISYSAVTHEKTSVAQVTLSGGNFESNAEELNWPHAKDNTTGSIKLVLRAQGGAPYMMRPISFSFGQVIPAPEVNVSGNPLTKEQQKTYWFGEPYTTNSHSGASYYWSPHAERVYAAQPGLTEIIWRKAESSTNSVDETDPKFANIAGVFFELFKTNYVVSGSAVKTPRNMYWTEGRFRDTGKPVTVPAARVGDIKIVYNPGFPEFVGKENAIFEEGDEPFITNRTDRTLWFDASTTRQILARNREGRVFVEVLGDVRDGGPQRNQLGFEIVDVIRQPSPVDVTIELGEKVTPPGSPEIELFPEPLLSDTTKRFAFRHSVTGSDRIEYFAIRETANQNDYQVHWMEGSVAGLRWPSVLARYEFNWPDDPAKYSHYIRADTEKEGAKSTAVPLPTDNVPIIEYQDIDPQGNTRAFLTEEFKFFSFLDVNYPAHRTLLRFTSGDSIAFERVLSVLESVVKRADFDGSLTSPFFLSATDIHKRARIEDVPAWVGQRLAPPSEEITNTVELAYLAGYIHQQGGGTGFSVTAYQDPFAVGFEEAARGSIIPVNAGHNNSGKLEVWWYRKNNQDLAQGFQPIFWPAVIGRYSINWPTTAPHSREIILASNDGSGGLGSLEAKGTIYFQNDPDQPGHNPNEEHALMLGGQAYALRDDLNVTDSEGYSSDPYVLLEYPDSDGRPSMSVFRVLREKPEDGVIFDYITEVGRILQAPMPLPLLPKPVVGSGKKAVNFNTESEVEKGDFPGKRSSGDTYGPFGHYRRFTFEDRKNELWVYRGFHAGLPDLAMGTYDSTTHGIGTFRSATAVVGKEFTYSLHVSRRIDSLLVSESSDYPLPVWLRISGLTLIGTPTIADVGTTTVQLVLSDVGDDSEVTNTLQVAVSATGPEVTQHKLSITSTNSFAGANVTYSARPPYLAQSPVATNSFTMRFTYRTQEGFAWPGLSTPPPIDSIVPYLRKRSNGKFVGDAESSTKITNALDIVYRPVWPANPPRLFLGDTLLNPKLGLPQVRGQTSLQILYQQSIAADITLANVSAVLHDPTREKFVDISKHGMDILPPSVRTERFQGKLFFPNLPPHLIDRLFFDPNRGEKGHLVFSGEFKDEPLGEKYVLLNVLRGSDLNLVKDLTPSSDSENESNWHAAIDALATTVETFHENPEVPGTFISDSDLDAEVEVGDLAEVLSSETAVDSYALSASGPGKGFLTLIAANGRAFTPEGDPVTMHILRVAGPLVRGELKVLPSPNPLSELLTVRHTSDLAGKYKDFEYEWKIAPPVDGFPPRVDETLSGWTTVASGTGIPFVTLGGSGIQVLIDNYLIMRYRPKNPDPPLFDQWSDWTDPQLAEGWIKRVLAGINPFNQRVTDLFNNRVNTDVSLLTQAGPRWEGDVALNLETINNSGLIEIYETVLRRGKSLSIESGINFGPANDALLLAAGYLNDLYMMLGNEAWADAANPTIGIGTKNPAFGDIATALFAFKGQQATLLEEELALLRGRDDFFQPGVEVRPVYNRLFWNYTRGIDSGEVIYALNYNIQENNDTGVDGVINADDARKMFPQGHGDAYGHYLTALKGYYSLLLDTDFDWVPRIEAVTVLGKAVSVDFQDERKFAAAAAAVTRAGRQVFDLTWRKDYIPGDDAGWEHFSATRTNDRRRVETKRHWGLDHWASRTGQGAYINWAMGNSILPDVDPDPTHEGIQKVDRTTVPELIELPVTADALQTTLDNAAGGLTPLGLADGSLAFDIDPIQVTGPNSETHFEQVYSRAKAALINALAAFDDAKDVTRLLRSEQDSLAELQAAVAKQELAYINALIEIYGTPYPDDIGPGKTFKQGYDGPDLIHYKYVDTPELSFPGFLKPRTDETFFLPIQQGFEIDIKNLVPSDDSSYEQSTNVVEFVLPSHGFFGKPPEWTGRRKSPGRAQQAISGIIHSRNQLFRALDASDGDKEVLDLAIVLYKEGLDTAATIRDFEVAKFSSETGVAAAELANDLFQIFQESTKEEIELVGDSTIEGFPRSTILGVASGGDLSSTARSALLGKDAAIKTVINKASIARNTSVAALRLATDEAAATIDLFKINPLNAAQGHREAEFELQNALDAIQGDFTLINAQMQAYDDSQRNLRAIEAEGDRIQAEREIFRKRSAALVQGFRTRDAAFRIFRNEKLERYKTLFDLAARYAFLAANAYDYETGLLNTPQGKEFVKRIVNSRALGVMRDGEPQFAGSNTGDPGLSSVLAEMKADFDVLKGRLGFNNPASYGTTVSLRTENERIIPAADGDAAWQDVLERGRRANLLEDSDVVRYCMQIDPGNGLPVPGIVLEFGTTIDDGVNVFGQVLSVGDHDFDTSLFATKIFSVGVVFEGYIGMDNPVANTSAIDAAGGFSPPDPSTTFLGTKGLAATPDIYLIPVGLDMMRSPPLGDASEIRSWNVDDVAIPVPFNIGGSDLSTKALWQSNQSLSEQLFSVRKHSAFRPVSTTAAFGTDVYFGTSLRLSQFTNNRLIGRSVWNTKWKLVIPGHKLLGDPNEGLDRFIQTVKDIKLHYVTYSYAGN